MSRPMSDDDLTALAEKAGGVVSHYRTYVKQINRSNDLTRVEGAIKAIEEMIDEFAGADLRKHGLKTLKDTLNGFKGTLVTRKNQLNGTSPRRS